MPVSLLDQAKAERAAIKDHLEFLQDEVNNHLISPLSLIQVEQYMLELDEDRKQLQPNHGAILLHTAKGTDTDSYVTEYKALGQLASRLYRGLHGIKSSFPTPTPAPVVVHAAVGQHGIKLPPLELPKFSGNLQEWVPFRDLFTTAVHNSTLTKVEKLTQLKSLLTGEAARQVRSLILCDANYDIAWTSLTERYENNRELLFSIIRRLITQPIITQATAASLRTLIDTTKECVRSLEILTVPTQHWDAILLYIIFSKLDPSSRELWEQSLPDTAIPNLSKMYDFIEQRARALAASSGPQQQKSSGKPQQQVHVRAHHVTPSICKLGCTQGHSIYKCEEFQKQTPQQRNATARRLKLCINCLGDSHITTSCNSNKNCKTCNRRHNTLLHFESRTFNQSPPTVQPSPPTSSSHHVHPSGPLTSGVLATARLRVLSGEREHLYRALIDGGSTNTHITMEAAKRLKLRLRPCYIPMTGHGNVSVGAANHLTTLEFTAHFNSKIKFAVSALVVRSISGNIPYENLNYKSWNHITSLSELADPEYYKPSPVDILLGTDVVWNILGSEKVIGTPGQPIAVKSSLGWLIAGSNINSSMVATHTTHVDLDFTLRRFWEQEVVNAKDDNMLTTMEKACEHHFDVTHSRDNTGRYTVSLPFKDPMPTLGASRKSAVQRFIGLENKYVHQRNIHDNSKKQALSQQWDSYKQFMKEYEDLGHMELVPVMDRDTPQCYYIPHHSVVKESSTTTKLRVVFDASAGTTSGKSLNDCLMVGPQLQETLWNIMLRFRIHPIVFTADIAKMYRQILVTKDHTDFQRIVWREHPNQPLQDYRLRTVTYGTASAPYLAVKCLQQLALDERVRFPKAASVVLKDFYIDDTASGCATLDDAKSTVSQLISLCQSGGMELRKWTTNSSDLLETIPENLRETENLVEIVEDATIKTLGVFWNPTTDKYLFKLSLAPNILGKYTKRIILSEIAKIYDPLGWISPVIIVCKIFMQSLWKLKHDWDDILPDVTQQAWIGIKHNLTGLELLEIPRCVIPLQTTNLTLIGCSDASTTALSACVYIFASYNDGSTSCHLLTSKTKVAPVKHVTVARLELNAAVMLSDLLHATVNALPSIFTEIKASIDSTIAHHWITSNSPKWKPYIRRRIEAIWENIPTALWYHIPGEQNPADCASRGITSHELLNHPQWWNGVSYFHNPVSKPELLSSDITHLEMETRVQVHKVQPKPLHPVYTKFSDFTKLQRTLAFVIRFLNNWARRQSTVPPQRGPLTTHELLSSHNFIIRQLQLHCFVTEINEVKQGRVLTTDHHLLKLNPFLGHDNLLRVGGRLRNACLPLNQKHPILLPRGHHVTNIIIMNTHLKNFHAGASATVAALQQRYWVTNARDSVRQIIRKCVICAKHRKEFMTQIMGDLPTARINPSRPFSKVGVDYAGPLTLRPMVRSNVSLKCWLAVFVCMCTRAVHVEVVSSLSTECFLASLRRFWSRRGIPTDIYSDCGSNFKGANNTLRGYIDLFQRMDIQNACTNLHINWHFIPPGAPHFGGLWEAGIKSIKYHLVRVMGNARLTYEEMHTLVTQIEGILNSRPLVAASTDPNDLEALTPGHFLIGTAITALPEPNLTKDKINYVKRWKLIQQQRQQFWARWSKEYLTRLQQRPKWLKPQASLTIGHMVIVKDERLPPLNWKLGRVLEVHPGNDGHVRVATVKTADGIIKRPIVKLSMLPITPS